MADTVNTSVRLPRALHDRLQAEAERQRRSVHNLMLIYIERGLGSSQPQPPEESP